jgi:predicted nucleic acid-binding protein
MMRRGKEVVIDHRIALSASDISFKYQLPLADSIIYCVAQQYDGILWTMDSHFKDMPNVKYFEKK